MFDRTHKESSEARNYNTAIEQLIEYISCNDPIFHEVKTVRPKGKSRKEGGKQVHIEKVYRKNAEHKYRMKVKRQVLEAANDSEGEVIVEGIAYCQPWDWRW